MHRKVFNRGDRTKSRSGHALDAAFSGYYCDRPVPCLVPAVVITALQMDAVLKGYRARSGPALIKIVNAALYPYLIAGTRGILSGIDGIER